MQHLEGDSDAAAALIERRWFAAHAAARSLQAECEVLREVMEMAENAWRHARTQLAQFESLCDALEQELAEREGPREALPCAPARRAVSTAA